MTENNSIGICPYTSTGLWVGVSKPVEQMTDKEIVEWFVELLKLDGYEDIDINDYSGEGETAQFFRKFGLDTEMYYQYLDLNYDDGPFDILCDELGVDEVYVADGVWWSRSRGYYCEH